MKRLSLLLEVYDYLIVGSGMTIAYEDSLLTIDKEDDVASGVLHAGFYYTVDL